MESIELFEDLWDVLSFEDRHELVKMLDSRVDYYETRINDLMTNDGNKSYEFLYETSLKLVYKSLKKLDDYDQLVKELSDNYDGIEEMSEKELYTYYKRKYFALIAEKEETE
jgi:hypothetical protein